MNTEKQLEKGISDLAGVFTDPIIVFPGGWGDTLPDWLKQAITMERLVMNMKALKGHEMTGTDAEACAYLYTACLEHPVNRDWGDIYLYVSTQTCRKWRQVEVPTDIAVESLRDDQKSDLSRLKEWLRRRRMQARLERDRAERHQKAETTEAEAEAILPSLFDF